MAYQNNVLFEILTDTGVSITSSNVCATLEAAKEALKKVELQDQRKHVIRETRRIYHY